MNYPTPDNTRPTVDTKLLPSHLKQNFYGAQANQEDSQRPNFSLDSWASQDKSDTMWNYVPGGLGVRAATCVALYLIVGTIVYTQIAGFSLLDAIYFCVVTVTTVGYGDLSNHGEGIKLFACAYILCGVAMIGSLLSSLVEMVVDRQEDILVKMLAAGEVQTKAEEVGRETVQSTSEASTFMPRMKAKMTYHQVRVFNSAVIFVALVALGVVVFGTNGQLDVVDAFYLTIVSASTVGYGDYYPKTAASKTFAIFFLPLATLMLAKIITDYTEMRVEEKTVSRQHAILMASIGSKEFLAMDTNRDGKLSRLEFLERMLVAQEKCGAADIQAIHARFDQIDVDGSGFIEEREAVMTFD